MCAHICVWCVCVCLSVCVCACMCVCVCVYTVHIESEFVYVCVCVRYIYIYIWRERERERVSLRERERERERERVARPPHRYQCVCNIPCYRSLPCLSHTNQHLCICVHISLTPVIPMYMYVSVSADVLCLVCVRMCVV
ncbi:MAG TPA: hypothetical protein V6C97_09325 [Oculatellaceae cyanobacterium]